MSNLFVVATPIGNLSDVTERAKTVLSSVSVVLCEDTRTSSVLLNALGVKKELQSYHKFNEREKAAEIIDEMTKREFDVAIITDAGTPGISDPGAIIVDLAREKGINVVGVPGACACTLAMSVSGFEGGFAFYGFLSRKKSELKEFFGGLSGEVENHVFYESPKRIIETLEALAEALPDCKACVFNDLTKKFERAYRGNIADVLAEITANENYGLGEYTVVFNVKKREKEEKKLGAEVALFDRLLNGENMKDAQTALSEEYGRNELYDAALKLKKYLNIEKGFLTEK